MEGETMWEIRCERCRDMVLDVVLAPNQVVALQVFRFDLPVDYDHYDHMLRAAKASQAIRHETPPKLSGRD